MLTKIVNSNHNHNQNATDHDLVVASLTGNSQSFRLLYQRHQQRVRNLLYQLCGYDQLDDLVQEVFLKAWKGLPKLRQPSEFSTWIYRITWNVASDRRKELAQTKDRISRYQQHPLLDPINQNNNDLMTIHYQNLVQWGLQELSIDHRAVLVLHDLEDLPQKEIAQILQIPIGTVKSRLFHARESMKKFLTQQGVSL